MNCSPPQSMVQPSKEALTVPLLVSQHESTANTSPADATDLSRLSIALDDHAVQQADWITLNDSLRRRGLDPVHVSHPAEFAADGSFTLFDHEASCKLREIISTLLRDSDRRQELFDELVHTSNGMKREMEKLEKKLFEYRKQVSQLEAAVLSKSDSSRASFSESQAQANPGEASQSGEQIKVIPSGTRKPKPRFDDRLDQATESSPSVMRGNTSSVTLPPHHSSPRSSTSSTSTPKQSAGVPMRLTASSREPTSLLFRCDSAVLYLKLEKCKKKVSHLKRTLHDVLEENKTLRVETLRKPRPEEQEKVTRELEAARKLLQENGLSLQRNAGECSTKLADLSECPAQVCRKYLKEACKLLRVTDLSDMQERLHQLQSSYQLLGEHEKLQNLVSEIVFKGSGGNMNNLEHGVKLVSELTAWNADRNQMEEIHKCLRELSLLVLPWDKMEGTFGSGSKSHSLTCHDIVNLIRRMMSSYYEGPKINYSEGVQPEHFQLIVENFMKLFDVSNVSHVYTRMHDVYVRHFEMSNVLHAIREILHLGPDQTWNDLVNAVGRLAKARHLLHVRKLDRVIKGIEYYDAFFADFHAMVTELQYVLGVKKMEAIVPTVKGLLADSVLTSP